MFFLLRSIFFQLFFVFFNASPPAAYLLHVAPEGGGSYVGDLAAGAPSPQAVRVDRLCGSFKLTFTANTPPPDAQVILLSSLPGVSVPLGYFGSAEVESVELRLPGPLNANLDVITGIVPSITDKAGSYDDLVVLPSAVQSSWRSGSSERSAVSEQLPWPSGVSRSLKGALPGLYSPALLVKFHVPTTDSTLLVCSPGTITGQVILQVRHFGTGYLG